ncbi:VOC family protein [Gracilibacillus kekensis]|uniref:PhnB protein n=1 Tax=Gracilibacillus kekensis TaxID=1027249 RepID=A0A1M7QCG0_9BACI|nr:VOC family protein [Gracilibacillus kekensis]SHN28452.1 PhnB protein [Gracilibacillus kekensis]
MRITPYISFDGKCEEAFLEYQRIFGGKIVTMLKYRDSPMVKEVDPDSHNRIIHASLQINDFILAGADTLHGNYKKPQGVFVILNFPEQLTAKKVFDSLSDGGEVLLPFEETFWSTGYGILVDRFGVPWKINCD